MLVYFSKIYVRNVIICLFILIIIAPISSHNAVWAEPPLHSERINQLLENLESPYGEDISTFYSERDYHPIWFEDYRVNESGEELLAELSNAAQQGLDPEDYGGDEVQWMRRSVGLFPESDHIIRAEVLGKLEVELTKNFMKFIDHLTGGRINPKAVNGKWFLKDHRQPLVRILSSALEHGISSTLRTIASEHDGYEPLLEALAFYRAIQDRNGWSSISKGPLLGPGSKGERVVALRHRLTLTGDVQGEPDKRVYNEDIEKAVRRFQHRHGLTADGLVGPKTLSELNVPVEMRIKQILLNLERRRWMPRDLGPNHVYVNIPDFMLTTYLKEEKHMEMRVIVGKPMSQTPIFSDSIEYVVFNPYWYVPRSIATEEIFPKFLEDPMYLVSKNYEIVDWDEQILEMDLLTEENLQDGKVRIRQKPGPSNALGLVKFMFPNDHAVYLHDTPADYLFDESERDFSHGCIRIQDPLKPSLNCYYRRSP